MDTKRILSAFSALMIVTSVVGGFVAYSPNNSPVGEAEAWGEDSPCKPLDYFLHSITSGIINSEKCGYDNARSLIQNQSEELQEAQMADSSEARNTLYANALSVKQSGDNTIASINNSARNIDQKARTEAMAAIAANLNSSATEAELQSHVDNATNETFSPVYSNYYTAWNSRVIHLHYMHEKMYSENEFTSWNSNPDAWHHDAWDPGGNDLGAQIDLDFIDTNPGNGDYSYSNVLSDNPTQKPPSFRGFNNQSVDTGNGTKEVNKIVLYFRSEGDGVDTGAGELVVGPKYGEPVYFASNNYRYNAIVVNNATWDGGTNQIEYIDFSKWKATGDLIDQEKAQVNANMDAITTTYWNKHQNGTVNASDVVQNSPQTLAEEYAAKWNSTGWWAYAVAMLSSAGMGYPDAANVSNMTISTNGTNQTGMAFIDQAALDNLSVGDTVYPSNYSEPIIWVNQSSGNMTELTDPFTLQSAYDRNGTSINTVPYNEVNSSTTNTTEYEEDLSRLEQLIASINERENVTSGGGGGGSGGSGSNLFGQTFMGFPVWIIAGAAILIIVALGRDNA